MVKGCGGNGSSYLRCTNCIYEDDELKCGEDRRANKRQMIDMYPQKLFNPIISLWKDSMFKTSPDELTTNEETSRFYRKEEEEREKEDVALLEIIKHQVSPEYFKSIKFEMEESENPYNFSIVNESIGEPQKADEGDYNIWVNQSCGIAGDDYSGTICMLLPSKKYFKWHYYM